MKISISKSEWEVMTILWANDGLTGTEVHQRLSAHTNWHLKTVNTFLMRLTEKGILAAKKEGRANRYFSLVTRENCIRSESRSFLDRVFGGKVKPLVMHFVETSILTEAEIIELREVLDKRLKSSKKEHDHD